MPGKYPTLAAVLWQGLRLGSLGWLRVGNSSRQRGQGRASRLSLDFRADSRPSLPPMLWLKQLTPSQQQAELFGCVIQSHYKVKAWVHSNAGVLLSSGRGFCIPRQYTRRCWRPFSPWHPNPTLNTVLIMPDADGEIMRGSGQGVLYPKSQITQSRHKCARPGSVTVCCYSVPDAALPAEVTRRNTKGLL